MPLKTKLLFLVLIVDTIFTGCMKDTQQAVPHVSAVNASLTGTWMQGTGSVTYYNAFGKMLYSTTPSFVNFQFDGKTTAYMMAANSAPLPGSYNINTVGNADFINTSGNFGKHQYLIIALHNLDLTLSETINTTTGDTLTVGAKSVIYYRSVQLNTYNRKSLLLE
ncbi:MAG: hypothetical protein JWP37_2074 [Mucilaginibacter sp.]|nr:hypothetical protein [Mucilaginibacter sp.]